MDDDIFWWRADALCAQVDSAPFFARKGDNAGVAKRLCRKCPVRAECLAESLIFQDEYGIWGGFGRGPRRRMARKVGPNTSAMTIALAAIKKEEGRREQARPADHRGDVRRRRGGGQLHPRADRRPEERADLVPRRADPT